MATPTHPLAEHRQIMRNLWVRLSVSTACLLGFAFLCFIAWRRDWSGFGKFISIAGMVAGVIAIAADLSAVREEKRAMRRFERARKKA